MSTPSSRPLSGPIKTYLDGIQKTLSTRIALEHAYRPALVALLGAADDRLQAINEPKRQACGAPDLVVLRAGFPLGYVECKDIGVPLDKVEKDDQLARYLPDLSNLILTDYLEFRHYLHGELRLQIQVARLDPRGRLVVLPDGAARLEALLGDFLAQGEESISDPADLARRMARLAHLIRDVIVQAFAANSASALLSGWRKGFARVLIADLDQPEKTPEFADMVAQTLAYGLFSARIMDPTFADFSRPEAQRLIPKSNPFLRDFFYQITGPALDDEPFACFVDELVALLRRTDMPLLLEGFGKRTRREDPIIHFYETFLAAYDPRLRKSRGVYFTPMPVVSYIVRSVDQLLRTRFGCADGLADSSTVPRPAPADWKLPELPRSAGPAADHVHRVLLLDFACGTGTFPYAVIDHIRQQFMDRQDAGMWPGYVRDHLLRRLFGFELMMAPYAVAHFKLTLQLAARDLPEPLRAQWAYLPEATDRLAVYLTNTLEQPHTLTTQPDLPQWCTVAEETSAANEVKSLLPIMVVMGNPPYAGHSANASWRQEGKKRVPTFIGRLLQDYYKVDGQPLGERNPKWLQDDYVKFIRFGQWRIEQTGSGILAVITNNGYLDNPTFRGMRQQLLQAFSEIYILNLHGSTKKKERAPDGGKDENVFDIQSGVAIALFVREPGKSGPASVHYADLWGRREAKYGRLLEDDVRTTTWETCTPRSPLYLFAPQDTTLLAEYERGRRITDIMPINVLGFQTHRDHFAIDFDRERLRARIQEMRDTRLSDEEFRQKCDVSDSDSWKLAGARSRLRQDERWERALTDCLYRPFDLRPCYFSDVAMDRPRRELLDHVVGRRNLCLGIGRQGAAVNEARWALLLCARGPADANVFRRGGISLFPLCLFGDELSQGSAKQELSRSEAPRAAEGPRPNLSPSFIADVANRLGLVFAPLGPGALTATFGPEDVFHWIYAVLHSPTYRTRYAEFLKSDFPRIPLTSDVALFRRLCVLGGELVGLHLLESPAVSRFITRYPLAGGNQVEPRQPHYDAEHRRVYINSAQYFEGVPADVWAFRIGGYQVCEKWLKDRRGRTLSYDDLTHYQRIVVALAETLRLMAEIDRAIPSWPIP